MNQALFALGWMPLIFREGFIHRCIGQMVNVITHNLLRQNQNNLQQLLLAGTGIKKGRKFSGIRIAPVEQNGFGYFAQHFQFVWQRGFIS